MEENSILINDKTTFEKLRLDNIDKRIITLLQENPNITHSQIARKLNRSQPTIGVRIKKLVKTGIFQFQPGINFKKVAIHLVEVNLKVKNSGDIMEMVKHCPFMVNAFRLSGDYNVKILLASSKINKLYSVVNQHFRNNKEVRKISMEIITDIAKDFVMPINFDSEVLDPSLEDGCGDSCEYCRKKKIMRFR